MENRRILRTQNPQARTRFYAQADNQALLGPRHFVAGFIQHPATKLYQVWLSTNGLDLTYLSAHRVQAVAENDVQAVKAVLSSQDIYDEAKLADLFKRLEEASDEKPQPLPDDLVMRIIQAIRKSLPSRV